MISQTLAPGVGEAAVTTTPKPIATATASARVMRPATITVRVEGDDQVVESSAADPQQRSRDKAGTVWIEFS